MKTIATLFFTAVLSLSALAGNEAYQKAMGEALQKMGSSRSVEDYTETANQFKQIANVAKEEWLPLYYHAQCYILMGFNTDRETSERDAYLDEAQKSLDAAMKLNDQESELYALQSMLHTARMVIDPMNRGQKMMGASGAAIGKSLGLNPNNPRAQYLLLSNEVGQAQFFGKDVSEYCERINSLVQNWDAMNKAPQFYPTWGKAQIVGMAKQCQ